MTTDLEVSYPYDTVVGWVSYPYDKALLCYRNRAFSASYGVRSAGMSYPYDMHTGVPGGHSERALTHRFRFNSQASHGFSPSRLHAGSDPQEQGTHPSVSYPYDNPGPLQPDAPALLYADDTVSFGMARPDVFSAPCYVPLPGSDVALSYPYDRVLLTHRSRTLSQGYESQGSAVSYPYDIQADVLELTGLLLDAGDLAGAHDGKYLSTRKPLASVMSYAYDSHAASAPLPAASVWSSAFDVKVGLGHAGKIAVSYAYDTRGLAHPNTSLSYPYDNEIPLQPVAQSIPLSYPYDKSNSVQASCPPLMSYAYDKALLMLLSRTLPYAYGGPFHVLSYPYDTVNFADGQPALKPGSYGDDHYGKTAPCYEGSLSYPYDKPLSSPSATASPFMSYPYDVLLNVSYAYDKALLVQRSRTLSHVYESRDPALSYPYDRAGCKGDSCAKSPLSYPYDKARSVSMMSYAYDMLRQGDLVSYPYDMSLAALLIAKGFLSYPYDNDATELRFADSSLSYPYDIAYSPMRVGMSYPYDSHPTGVCSVAIGAVSYPYDMSLAALLVAEGTLSYPYDKAHGVSCMSYPYDIVRSTLQVHSPKAVSYPYDKQPGLPWPPGWALPDVVALRHRKPHQTQPLPPRNQIQTKPATRRVFLCLEKSA